MIEYVVYEPVSFQHTSLQHLRYKDIRQDSLSKPRLEREKVFLHLTLEQTFTSRFPVAISRTTAWLSIKRSCSDAGNPLPKKYCVYWRGVLYHAVYILDSIALNG
jgi:hypothetical protein